MEPNANSQPIQPAATPPAVNPAPVNPAVATGPAPATNQIQYASFGKRLGASLLDGLIFGVVSMIFSFLFGKTTASSGSVGFSVTGLPALILNLLVIFYYVFFIGKFGQTLGKMALKIKVVKIETGNPPGFGGAALREIVGKLLSSAVLLLGYFWMLWDPQKQTWHDKIAKTVVIMS